MTTPQRLSAATPEMGEVLTCNVCYNAFNTTTRKPIDLGCGHCFCSTCVTSSRSAFRVCPECRANIKNPHVSFALLRVVTELASSSGHGRAACDVARPDHCSNPTAGRPMSLSIPTAPTATQPPLAGLPLPDMWYAARSRQMSEAPHFRHALAPHSRHCTNLVQEGRQQRQSLWASLWPILILIYILSPIDLLPDIIPIIGWMDDFILLCYLVYNLCTPRKMQ